VKEFNNMKITEEQEEQIINFGVFGYSNERMSCLLGIDENGIEEEMEDTSSEFCKLYVKGKIKADYVIDCKLFDMARSGDIKALDKLNSRKTARKRSQK